MIDLKLLRAEPDRVKELLARRGAAEQAERLLELDQRRRELIPEIEGGRARQNEASDRIAQAKRAGESAEAEIDAMRELSGRIKSLEAELAEIEGERDQIAAQLPNLPDPDAPDGDTDEDAVELRRVGTVPEFDFEPRDHLEIGTRLGLIEIEAAAKVSGARFAYLKAELVQTELALVQWVMGLLREQGHQSVIPPVLVREEALFGTGFLPGDRDQIYELPKDDLYLVGTAEVPLAGLHADQILTPGQLPLRYAGYSPCFRREAGAAGRDTRGIFRVHQFDKVEMFSFVEPSDSAEEHERILATQERILSDLELPYRVVNVAVGDLGASAAKKYDCEAWIPSQSRYRELTSCSNTTDFQARRLGCRFRPGEGEAPLHAHTLNGTAVAVGRTLIALIENRQDSDGGFTLPECLVQHGAPSKVAPAAQH